MGILNELWADRIAAAKEDGGEKSPYIVKYKRADGKVMTAKKKAENVQDLKDYYKKDFISAELDYEAMNEARYTGPKHSPEGTEAWELGKKHSMESKGSCPYPADSKLGKKYWDGFTEGTATKKRLKDQGKTNESSMPEVVYPKGLDRIDMYAFRKGWQNPGDTPEDWEFKSNSKEGDAFRRGQKACAECLEESKNHMDETEYSSWASWRAACKKACPDVKFEGDKDIAQALDSKGVGIGEWDGSVGVVYKTKYMSEDTESDYRSGWQFGRDVKNNKHAKLSDFEKKKYSPAFLKGYDEGLSLKESADLVKQLVRGEKGPKGLLAKLDNWLSKLIVDKDANRFLPADRAVKALESYGFSKDQVHKIREAAAEAAQTAIARMQKKHGDAVPDKYLSKMGSSFAVFDLYLNVSEKIHEEFAALMRQLFDAKIDKMKDELELVKEDLLAEAAMYHMDDIPTGGTVIYKVLRGGHKISKVKSKRDPFTLLLQNGDTIQNNAVVSTDASDWDDAKFRPQGGWPKAKKVVKESKYGVVIGQVYVPADGSKNELKVLSIDDETEDATVFDKVQNKERKIDLFKLAKVRYSLKEALNEARSIPAWFKDGAKVKLMPEYADKDPDEVFTLQSVDDERGKARIADEQGRGWNISYYQVYPKNKTPAIHESFSDKRAFKRAELEFELGHETNDTGNRTFERVRYGIEINGKVWQKEGTPVAFNSKAAAEKAIMNSRAMSGKNAKAVPLKEDKEYQALGKALVAKPGMADDQAPEEKTAVNTPPAEKIEADAADTPSVEGEAKAEFKIGDVVKPLKGPHKGEPHDVVKVFPDGSVGIKPKDIDDAANKYKAKQAKAAPADVVLAESFQGQKRNQAAWNQAKKDRVGSAAEAEAARERQKKHDAMKPACKKAEVPEEVKFLSIFKKGSLLTNVDSVLAEQNPDRDGIMPLSYRPGKGHKIEAYGRKGMKNSMWRKTFKNGDAMSKWCDENDATVEGSRDLDKDELR